METLLWISICLMNLGVLGLNLCLLADVINGFGERDD